MRQRAVGGVVLLALSAARAWAQANDEVDRSIQFNFSLPGARSMAMGGAFLGASDDATAAYTNPAGLTVLREPEVSLEGRGTRWSTDFVVGGHDPGPPTGLGDDTHAGLVYAPFRDTSASASFLSYAHPHGRWSFALYRHQLADFQTHDVGGGDFVTDPACDSLPGSTCRHVYVLATLDLDIVSYGVAAAYRFADSFSFGAGVSYARGRLAGSTGRYHVGDPFGSEPPQYDSEHLIATTTQRVDDDAVSASFGFVWKPISWLGVGGVYRQGPRFDLSAAAIQGPFLTGRCPGCFHDVAYQGTFRLPEIYGIGFVVRPPHARWRAALDVNHVRYSLIMDGFVNVVAGIANDDHFATATPGYSIADVNEVRAGAEYLFPDLRWPLAIRVGAWRDPDHRLHHDGTAVNTEKYRFKGGSDDTHYTAGAGIVAAHRLQIDLAVDVSDVADSLSLSTVLFF